jgi:hypothetical protein
MEPTDGPPPKPAAQESLNLAIAYAAVSAFTLGLAVCMIIAGIIHANWTQTLIWSIAAAASLTSTFKGARKIRKAAGRL